MFIDKIEMWPEEKRACIVYAVKEQEKWPSGKSKYEILLLRLVCFNVKEWIFGRHKTIDNFVIVVW